MFWGALKWCAVMAMHTGIPFFQNGAKIDVSWVRKSGKSENPNSKSLEKTSTPDTEGKVQWYLAAAPSGSR